MHPSGPRQDGNRGHGGFAIDAAAGMAEQKEEEQKASSESEREGDLSDEEPRELRRHPSMASQRSYRSFMSARSFVSNDVEAGDDSFEETNGDAKSANRDSESDSDSDKFFDAVAVDDEIGGGAMCRRHGRQGNFV